jgi:Biotin carboxylase, N-terminal domain
VDQTRLIKTCLYVHCLLYADPIISTTFLTNISHFFLQNNYANVDLIVEIAENQKVDGACKSAGISRFVYWRYQLIVFIISSFFCCFFTAVWPGWGHASENPRLPSTLKEKGIQVII